MGITGRTGARNGMIDQLPPYPHALKRPDWEGYDYRNLPKPEEVTADKNLNPIFSVIWDWWDYVSYYIAADEARGIHNPVMVETKAALRAWLENAKNFTEPQPKISEVLHEAYDEHCEVCRRIEVEPGSYTEFLEQTIDEIRGMAEPLAYAIRESPPRDMKDNDIVQVGGIHEKPRWLDGEPEIPLEVSYLRTLLYTIYDDFPEVKLPPYQG